MVKHVTYVVTDVEILSVELETDALFHGLTHSQALLVQVYCAEADLQKISAITSIIASKYPAAVIAGATTIGEVAHGRLMSNQTVIGFTFFESSDVHLVAVASAGDDEQAIGVEIGRQVSQNYTDVAGVLLLATTLSVDAAALLKGLSFTLDDCPVFGGGAGDYSATHTSLVFSKSEQFKQGVIAVVFCGKDLHVEAHTYLGWQPLSHSMRITQADGLDVQQVDGRPAFDIYRRYLNILSNEQFLYNAMEFPFLLERDGEVLARIPVATSPEGALRFVADIHEGERFRIGYGDIDLIIENSKELHESMAEFAPQVVFLYTCSCRRTLMQESVELETLPLEAIAPTFGFYTYGEFYGSSNVSLLNGAMVAVGLREGPKHGKTAQSREHTSHCSESYSERDPLANQHTRVVSRLMRFIKVVSAELEASIEDATHLAVTDQLTRLANRLQLDYVLEQQVKLANRYATQLSIILLDMDYFKQINDSFGHLVGDKVLVKVAQTIQANIRDADIAGRWGGEEFLLVVPNTGVRSAALLAEKLRHALACIDLPIAERTTASFGVAEFVQGDNPETLVARADAALYAAKTAGRNRVEIA